ncbi:MAG: ATP-binding cassette domain-containing protein, partial [Atribacterota bacterium]
MIILKNIKVSFPGRILFDSLSWQIPAGSRIGLVGDNGVGKTTLLKIIMEKYEPDDGNVILPNGKKLGYLPQDLIVLSDYLLKDYLKETAGIVKLERRLKEEQEKLAKIDGENSEFKSISHHYEQTFHQFE